MPNPSLMNPNDPNQSVFGENTNAPKAFTIYQVEHGFRVGDLIWYDANQQRYKRATQSNKPLELVAFVISEHAFRRAIPHERISLAEPILETGANYYASLEPGAITQSPNSVCVGYALSEFDLIYLYPNAVPQPTPQPTATPINSPSPSKSEPEPTPEPTELPINPTTKRLGMNLNGIAPWSTEHPFIDVFKTSSQWIPHSESQWDTSEAIPQDEFGWVTNIPTTTQFTRVGTLILREIPDMYETGRYLVLYEGSGMIRYSFEATKLEAESRPGRDVIEVKNGGGGVHIEITQTDPIGTGDYIRNIRMIQERYEERFKAGEIFNPAFLDRFRELPLSCLRFMDWLNTNNSDLSQWADRPQLKTATWTRGVPIEVTVTLCNQLRIDGWWSIPHQATDEFVTNAATLVRDTLSKDLTAYIEYSNETWNWGFEQAQWSLQQGQLRWGESVGDAHMQWSGMKAAQFIGIWKAVFANGVTDQSKRVRGVLATQTAYKGLEDPLLNAPLWVAESPQNQPPHTIASVYAITGYFDGGIAAEANATTIREWISAGEVGFKNAINQIRSGNGFATENGISLPSLVSELFPYHQAVAKQHNLELVGYEWGTHIIPFGSLQNDSTIANWCIALNQRPEIADIYRDVMAGWVNANGAVFCHFSDIGTASKYGTWGALAYLNQPETPRWNALKTGFATDY